MKKQKPLTKKQQTYIDEKMMGRSPSVLLGNVQDCDNSKRTQEELAKQQQLLALDVGITRQDVVNGIMEAINRAKLQAEPATEIAGWKEIGKILGHYAPEVKKVVLTDDQDKVIRKLESLTTAELLALAEQKKQLGIGITINGEATRVQ